MVDTSTTPRKDILVDDVITSSHNRHDLEQEADMARSALTPSEQLWYSTALSDFTSHMLSSRHFARRTEPLTERFRLRGASDQCLIK